MTVAKANLEGTATTKVRRLDHLWNRLAFVFLIWIVIAVFGFVRYQPPAPQPASLPADRFSAHRALRLLETLVGNGVPHPAGSRQNQIVRERIVGYLQDYGYQPSIQRKQYQGGTAIENVLARLVNPGSDSAIALIAHYDSVEQGPGASDDGVGVAALLEVARMLKQHAVGRNDVIFLFTDGEESGTLGAEAFVAEHPWAADIKVVLNFDARGTAGPSLMFETSDQNAWLIGVLAGSLTRPVTSSLFDDVYQYLSNYTDFTPFRNAGVDGYNFAFIRGVENYHTERDDYEHVTPGSLQHHGDNAWQLTCALLDLDLDRRRAGDAVYTDLFAAVVAWWSQATGRIWATALLVLFAAFSFLNCRLGRMNHRQLVGKGFAVPIMMSLTGLSGWLADRWFRQADLSTSPWSWWAPLQLASYWIIMTGVVSLMAFLMLRRANACSTWHAVWTYWCLAGLVSAFTFPGASYLFLLPVSASLAAAVLGAVFQRRCSRHGANALVTLASASAAGCLWIPQQFLFYDALGLEHGIIFVCCSGVLLTTIAPLFCDDQLRGDNS